MHQPLKKNGPDLNAKNANSGIQKKEGAARNSATNELRQAMGLSQDDPRSVGEVIQARKRANFQAMLQKVSASKPKEEESIQAKSNPETNLAGSSQALPNTLVDGFKGSTGHDLSNVDVHYNSPEPENMGALAYAQGNEIHLAPGQEQHLPHEAAHIVQQREGRVKPTGETNGQPLNDDPKLESEADAMGAQALQLKTDNSAAVAPEESSAVVTQLYRNPIQRVDDPDKPDLLSYKGAAIGNQGRISSPANQYSHAKTKGVNVRSKPDGALKPIGQLLYNTQVHVVAYDLSRQFVFVVGAATNGWVNKDFVVQPLPEPGAELHHITEPNLTTILIRHYVDSGKWNVSTGNDLTTLAAAVLAINAGRIGVHMDWKKYKAYKEDHWIRGTLDPWMHENFAIYHGSQVVSGTNIWLPSTTYIRALQASGVIGTRPDWLNAVIGFGKSLAGFVVGVQAGIYGNLWDMLTGLWDVGKMIVDTIKGIFDGSLFTSIKEIYDKVTSMSLDDAWAMVKEIIVMGKSAIGDFFKSWNHGDEYKRWHFRGKIIGMIVTEIVLAIVTAGGSLGANLIAKLGKYFPKLAKICTKVLKVADKLTIGPKKKHRPDLDLPDGHHAPGSGHHPHGDKTPDFDPDDNEARDWFTTLALAKAITEGHDAVDTPVKLLIGQLNSTLAAKSSAVRGYEAVPVSGKGNTWEIIQFMRRRTRVGKYDIEVPKTPKFEFFSHLYGKSIKSLKKRADSMGWKLNDRLRSGTGWVYTDGNGIERIRYRKNVGGSYLHEETGYIRWADADGHALDINGKKILAGGVPVTEAMSPGQIRRLAASEADFESIMGRLHISIKNFSYE